MRLLSTATCTSGEPVSVSPRRYSLISADFCSLSSAIGLRRGYHTGRWVQPELGGRRRARAPAPAYPSSIRVEEVVRRVALGRDPVGGTSQVVGERGEIEDFRL